MNKIYEALQCFIGPDAITELRIFTKPRGGYIGYFDNLKDLSETAEKFSQRPTTTGIYYTPHILPQELLKRAPNKMRPASRGMGTRDKDVIAHKWLLIDIDPKRKSKTPSTDEEHDAALELAQLIGKYLNVQGFSIPAVIDSGNGYHLMYELEGAESSQKAAITKLLKQVLHTLHQKFSNQSAEVDVRVYNPSRIWRVPQTWSRKGTESTPERPWRKSKLACKPQGKTSRELLELIAREFDATQVKPTTTVALVSQLAAAATVVPGPKVLAKTKYDKLKTKLNAYLSKFFKPCEVQSPQDWSTGCKWVLRICPWDSNHTDSSAAVVLQASGVITARCHHELCEGHKRGAWYRLQDAIGTVFSRRSMGATTTRVAGLTDMGNASLLGRFCKNKALFVDDSVWFSYDETKWVLGSDRAAYNATKEVTTYWENAAYDEPDESRSKQIRKHMFRTEAFSNKRSMVGLASKLDEIACGIERFDTDPYDFNLTSGTLNLKTRELREHNPQDYLTRVSPVEYIPGAKCPLWEEFLSYILPDIQHRKCLQRFAGHWLTGNVDEQLMLFMGGTGANGKSTLISVLMEIFGDYAIVAPDNLLLATRGTEHPTGTADLRGARFVAQVEIDKGKVFNEAVIKKLTGGERLKARRMNQDFFEFPPTHKICVCANHRPIIKGNDEGIWRRIPVLPFEVRIPDKKKDRQLKTKLMQELSGIFNWMLVGLDAQLANGVAVPDSMWQKTREYKQEMDILGLFFEECCKRKDGYWVGQKILYQAYLRWNKELTQRPVNYRMFNRLMRERNFRNKIQSVSGKTTRTWQDISLLSAFSWGIDHPELAHVEVRS